MNHKEKISNKTEIKTDFNASFDNESNETQSNPTEHENIEHSSAKFTADGSERANNTVSIHKDKVREVSQKSPATSTINSATNKDESKPRARRIGLWSAVLASLLVASVVITNLTHTATYVNDSISTSEGAQEILKQRWSNKLELGARLVKNDDQITLKPADMTITHNKKESTTKIWVWDFAAEDGDYIQIKVDGNVITEPFMIKNQAVSFDVPAESKIEVIGVRDGGGGITYAIHHEVRGETYLNGMDIGGSNTYTLVRSDNID